MTATTAAPPVAGHPAKDLQKAKTTTDLITATKKCHDREDNSADQYYAAGDSVYNRIKGTRKWTLRIDKVLKARELRKIYYDAAAHIDEAARLLNVAVFQEQKMLGEHQKPDPSDFDPTK
jgi:hypothetical protein